MFAVIRQEAEQKRDMLDSREQALVDLNQRLRQTEESYQRQLTDLNVQVCARCRVCLCADSVCRGVGLCECVAMYCMCGPQPATEADRGVSQRQLTDLNVQVYVCDMCHTLFSGYCNTIK